MNSKKNEKQTMSLQLSKSSTPEQVKNYFQQVFELKQSGKEFPVNLDEVWPLVYRRKEEAVRVLKSDFIKNEDFNMQVVENQFLRRNAEKYKPGRPTENYYLSVGCLEYFIAKKVKPVFEVYRRVFHAAVENRYMPIMGLQPVYIDGKPVYNYIEVLKKLDYSTTSGSVSARRRNNPQEFSNNYGYWQITEFYALYLAGMVSQRKTQKHLKVEREKYLLRKNNQLSLIL